MDDLPPDLEEVAPPVRAASLRAAAAAAAAGPAPRRDTTSLTVDVDAPGRAGAQSASPALLPGQSLAEAALPPEMRLQLREREEAQRAAAAAAVAAVASPPPPPPLAGVAASEPDALGVELLEAGRAAAAQAKQDAERARRAAEQKATSGFLQGTAVKKGFLLGGSEKKKPAPPLLTAAAADDVVRPKKVGSGGGAPAGLVAEVQEAMRARGGAPAMQAKLEAEKGKWMTPELMEKIAHEPRLLAGMQNPRFAQALAEMGADPRAAMKKYAGDEGVQEFLRIFMGVMGSHFAKVGEKEDKVPSASAGAGARSEADARMGTRTGTGTGGGGRAEGGAGAGLTPVATRSLKAGGGGSGGAGAGGTRSGDGGAAPAAGAAAGSLLDPTLSSDQIAESVRSGNLSALSEEERRVLSSREAVELLRDPVMQGVLTECRADPTAFRKYMLVPEIARKINLMAKHGLIRFEK